MCHTAATMRPGRVSQNSSACPTKHRLQYFAHVGGPCVLPWAPWEGPKMQKLPSAPATSLPALSCEAISPLHESLKKHTSIHQKTTIPEKWIPGTLQGGVQGLGSTTSLIQGPVIKVKRAHISLLYMQFMSWHMILHGTLTPSQMNIEQISPWRIPVNCTNTVQNQIWAMYQPSEMQIGNHTHLHGLKPTAFKWSHHVHTCRVGT